LTPILKIVKKEARALDDDIYFGSSRNFREYIIIPKGTADKERYYIRRN
jgi:hypothetical protein